MCEVHKDKIKEIVRNFEGKKILVIGDMMLDHYIFGEVNRISPEAPVPVVEVKKEISNPGGAANVVNNIKEMKGIPIPVGIIGKDREGEKLKNLLKEKGINVEGLFETEDRPTTTKTRIIAHHQQVVRVDKEKTEIIPDALKDKIIDFVTALMGEIDAILFEDYDKGVIDGDLISRVKAISVDKILVADPKYRNFFEYKGFTIVKPNRKEAEWAARKILSADNVEEEGKSLRKVLECKALLITMGAEGMALFTEDGFYRIKNKAKEVYDVTGAGDTAIAAITLSLCAGANFFEASYIGNIAAGIKVGKLGAVPVTLEEILSAL